MIKCWFVANACSISFRYSPMMFVSHWPYRVNCSAFTFHKSSNTAVKWNEGNGILKFTEIDVMESACKSRLRYWHKDWSIRVVVPMTKCGKVAASTKPLFHRKETVCSFFFRLEYEITCVHVSCSSLETSFYTFQCCINSAVVKTLFHCAL